MSAAPKDEKFRSMRSGVESFKLKKTETIGEVIELNPRRQVSPRAQARCMALIEQHGAFGSQRQVGNANLWYKIEGQRTIPGVQRKVLADF